MQEILSNFLSIFSDHRNKKSSWGRWAGSIIIATILFNWTYINIKSGQWVAFDLYTAAILIGIYITLSVKSVFETSNIAINNKEPEIVNQQDKLNQIKQILDKS